jgi:hypothetical protein
MLDANSSETKTCKSSIESTYGISACIHFFCGKWIPPPHCKIKQNHFLRRKSGVEEPKRAVSEAKEGYVHCSLSLCLYRQNDWRKTMDIFKDIVTVFGGITTIGTVLVILVRPIREWVMGDSAVKAGMKCQLRADMLHTYYKNKDAQKIRQYEAENFEYSYKAYKALKGNSFIDKIKREVDEWEVVT